jgi:hypothetical protein
VTPPSDGKQMWVHQCPGGAIATAMPSLRRSVSKLTTKRNHAGVSSWSLAATQYLPEF